MGGYDGKVVSGDARQIGQDEDDYGKCVGRDDAQSEDDSREGARVWVETLYKLKLEEL